MCGQVLRVRLGWSVCNVTELQSLECRRRDMAIAAQHNHCSYVLRAGMTRRRHQPSDAALRQQRLGVPCLDQNFFYSVLSVATSGERQSDNFRLVRHLYEGFITNRDVPRLKLTGRHGLGQRLIQHQLRENCEAHVRRNFPLWHAACMRLTVDLALDAVLLTGADAPAGLAARKILQDYLDVHNPLIDPDKEVAWAGEGAEVGREGREA